jgi:hypothetical protein
MGVFRKLGTPSSNRRGYHAEIFSGKKTQAGGCRQFTNSFDSSKRWRMGEAVQFQKDFKRNSKFVLLYNVLREVH